MIAIIRVIVRLLLALRYRIELRGINDVIARGTRGVLFLPNHPSLLDPVMLISALHRRFRPRALADRDRIALPVVTKLSRITGAIPMPDPAVYGKEAKAAVAEALQTCVTTLHAGGNLLLYPAGSLARSAREELGGNSAVEHILAQAPEARVVLVRTRGLWGSMFGWASGEAPSLGRGLKRGLGYVLRSLVFFVPKRRVTITFAEPLDLPRDKSRVELNRYLESFYDIDPEQNLYVPRTLCERGAARVLPEPPRTRPEAAFAEVSPTVREQVASKLKELCDITSFSPELSLARDLGLDSLSRLELVSFVQEEFGHPCPNATMLETVGDLWLAAAGQAGLGAAALAPVPPAWFCARKTPIAVPEGETITEVFLRRAALEPTRAVFADQTSGVKSYRDLVTAMLVLAPVLRKLEGEHLGIMLPASVGASVFYLAALFAGKVPVMINWTCGARSMNHGVGALGVRHVLTARALVDKLDQQGVALGAVRERLLFVEDLGKRIGLGAKLWALLRARTSWRALRRLKPRDTAAVLFTSGSESLPKIVPLLHQNILANVRDVVASVRFVEDERLVGFLPPFHSFGLTATVALPVCSGLGAVFYPNPTEGGTLAKLIAAYRVTALVSTPTFLAGIVRAASDEQLQSLDLVVSGAEKCPDALYEVLAQRWPEVVVLEGYGITECSPVVSINRQDCPRRGTIGKLLPSLAHAVVTLDESARAINGAEGMLLVRGPSVFLGYLHHDGDSPFVSFEGKLWYRTGDLVREEQDGTLVFAGRLKRFIKLGGEMISLVAIEEALGKHAYQSDAAAAFAVQATAAESNPELVLFCVTEITRERANAALREAGLSALHNLRRVRKLDAIPVLGSGKTDYRALAALLAEV